MARKTGGSRTTRPKSSAAGASRAKASKPETSGPRASKPQASADPAQRAIEAALELAAERGWRRVTLGDVAREGRLSLAELYGLYPGRAALLAGFLRRIDSEVLGGGEAQGDSARDRLFDLLMRRFEALRQHKAAVEAILRDAGADPIASLCGVKGMMRSMSWMLEAAGIGSHGLLGRARAKGLALVYLSTLRVWLSDDSVDMSATMAALDKRLRRAEGVAEFCARFRPPRRRGEGLADVEAG